MASDTPNRARRARRRLLPALALVLVAGGGAAAAGATLGGEDQAGVRERPVNVPRQAPEGDDRKPRAQREQPRIEWRRARPGGPPPPGGLGGGGEVPAARRGLFPL